MLLVQNSTDSAKFVAYAPDPDGRGTISLVLSCLLTLLLCVWQALHLNVPAKGEKISQCILENIRWIIAGVYAPELVVFAAWRQWSSSKILGEIVAACQQDVPASPKHQYAKQLVMQSVEPI